LKTEEIVELREMDVRDLSLMGVDLGLFCFKESDMNFKSMCESYIEMSKGIHQISVRRKIWPPNISLLLGFMSNMPTGTPMMVVLMNEGGVNEQVKFGMNLFIDEEIAVLGWCPSVEDVMGQDWEFIE
jgi:hypothetical protein